MYFFGTEETGTLTTDSMWHYNTETKAKHMKHSKKEFYSDGMTKIESAWETQKTLSDETQKIAQAPGAQEASAPQLTPAASTSVTPPSLPCCTPLLGALQSDIALDQSILDDHRSPIPCCTFRSCSVYSRSTVDDACIGEGTSTLPSSIGTSRQSGSKGSRVGRGGISVGFMDSPTSPRSMPEEQASPATPLLDIAPEHPPKSNDSPSSQTPGKGKQIRRKSCGICDSCIAPPCGACTPCNQKYETFLIIL